MSGFSIAIILLWLAFICTLLTVRECGKDWQKKTRKGDE